MNEGKMDSPESMVKTSLPNCAAGERSVYAGVLRDDHSSPGRLPLSARPFEYKDVAAVVVENLASHFVSDLIRINSHGSVVERIHRELADLESLNNRLRAEVRVACNACLTDDQPGSRGVGILRLHQA